MTVAEYMDPKRFPLTTQGNLKPREQMMIDAVNYDALSGMAEHGETMDAEQVARWKELREKHSHREEVADELVAEAKKKGKK